MHTYQTKTLPLSHKPRPLKDFYFLMSTLGLGTWLTGREHRLPFQANYNWPLKRMTSRAVIESMG